MKVSVLTLGCKVNKYESDSILNLFKKNGYEISDKLEFADLYVVNTCAVTSEAEKKSRQMIARCKKINPQAKVFVCGCAAQNNPDQFLGKASLIKGVANKNGIVNSNVLGIDIDQIPLIYQQEEYALQSRTRAFIKIQDGCNNFCSYCIIPYLRGRSRSRNFDDILQEIKNLPSDIQEIVLTGINLSDFKINGQPGLLKLLQELDKYNLRLRLSSLEEVVIDEDFVFGLSKLNNFCPHFHLSLQSGSDTILKAMNRRYTTIQFKKACENIRKYFPLASITTDIIVGFPGESEKEFNETKEFIKDVNFFFFFVFSYSARQGTVAYKFKDIPYEIKKNRTEILLDLDKKLKKDFILKNKTGKILIEEVHDNVSYGLTENYIRCFVNQRCTVGDILNVSILQEKDGMAFARLI